MWFTKDVSANQSKPKRHTCSTVTSRWEWKEFSGGYFCVNFLHRLKSMLNKHAAVRFMMSCVSCLRRSLMIVLCCSQWKKYLLAGTLGYYLFIVYVDCTCCGMLLTQKVVLCGNDNKYSDSDEDVNYSQHPHPTVTTRKDLPRVCGINISIIKIKTHHLDILDLVYHWLLFYWKQCCNSSGGDTKCIEKNGPQMTYWNLVWFTKCHSCNS